MSNERKTKFCPFCGSQDVRALIKDDKDILWNDTNDIEELLEDIDGQRCKECGEAWGVGLLHKKHYT